MTEGPNVDLLADLLAEVNASIYALAAGRPGRASDDLWEFRCECGETGCGETVSLSTAAFEDLRRRRTPVLATGHTWRSARPRPLAG